MERPFIKSNQEFRSRANLYHVSSETFLVDRDPSAANAVRAYELVQASCIVGVHADATVRSFAAEFAHERSSVQSEAALDEDRVRHVAEAVVIALWIFCRSVSVIDASIRVSIEIRCVATGDTARNKPATFLIAVHVVSQSLRRFVDMNPKRACLAVAALNEEVVSASREIREVFDLCRLARRFFINSVERLQCLLDVWSEWIEFVVRIRGVSGECEKSTCEN